MNSIVLNDGVTSQRSFRLHLMTTVDKSLLVKGNALCGLYGRFEVCDGGSCRDAQPNGFASYFSNASARHPKLSHPYTRKLTSHDNDVHEPPR